MGREIDPSKEKCPTCYDPLKWRSNQTMNKEKLLQEINDLVFQIDAGGGPAVADQIITLIEKHMEEEDD